MFVLEFYTLVSEVLCWKEVPPQFKDFNSSMLRAELNKIPPLKPQYSKAGVLLRHYIAREYPIYFECSVHAGTIIERCKRLALNPHWNRAIIY